MLSLLRRYLQVYWLKPFDAVNDAANAWALRQFEWEEPILEVGGGDGMFSFIMHGGEFQLADDRYDESDPHRTGDIFDVHTGQHALTVRRLATRRYDAVVDLKVSHLLKCRDTQLYRSTVLAAPEPLPFDSASFKTVFLYFPHGLIERGQKLDYHQVLSEVRRVMQADGTLLMTAVNQSVAKYFVCYPLHQFFARKGWNRTADYFRRLDAGRYEEIGGLGHTLEDWNILLRQSGFTLSEAWTQVAPFAWRAYDFQTRPFLKALIRWSWFLRRARVKRFVKAVWVYAWLPFLFLFYAAFARPRPASTDSENEAEVFFVFRAVPNFD